jgi:hypothetical protein
MAAWSEGQELQADTLSISVTGEASSLLIRMTRFLLSESSIRFASGQITISGGHKCKGTMALLVCRESLGSVNR